MKRIFLALALATSRAWAASSATGVAGETGGSLHRLMGSAFATAKKRLAHPMLIGISGRFPAGESGKGEEWEMAFQDPSGSAKNRSCPRFLDGALDAQREPGFCSHRPFCGPIPADFIDTDELSRRLKSLGAKVGRLHQFEAILLSDTTEVCLNDGTFRGAGGTLQFPAKMRGKTFWVILSADKDLFYFDAASGALLLRESK